MAGVNACQVWSEPVFGAWPEDLGLSGAPDDRWREKLYIPGGRLKDESPHEELVIKWCKYKKLETRVLYTFFPAVSRALAVNLNATRTDTISMTRRRIRKTFCKVDGLPLFFKSVFWSIYRMHFIIYFTTDRSIKNIRQRVVYIIWTGLF